MAESESDRVVKTKDGNKLSGMLKLKMKNDFVELQIDREIKTKMKVFILNPFIPKEILHSKII